MTYFSELNGSKETEAILLSVCLVRFSESVVVAAVVVAAFCFNNDYSLSVPTFHITIFYIKDGVTQEAHHQ